MLGRSCPFVRRGSIDGTDDLDDAPRRLGARLRVGLDELREAKEIEQRAYDRFLQERDVLAQALASEEIE